MDSRIPNFKYSVEIRCFNKWFMCKSRHNAEEATVEKSAEL